MIYFDNSATTNPKPHKVVFEAYNSLINYSYNSGRGGYPATLSAAEKIYAVREKVAALVNAEPQCVVFTQNCTLSLNMAIKGAAKRGGHILISSLEHNAVLRPVCALEKSHGISFDAVPYFSDETQQAQAFEMMIKNNTCAIVSTMASNVFGCKMPIKAIGAVAAKHGIPFIVDGAQGAGVFDINMKRDNISVLCCAGHKGLYGALALGFMAVRENVTLSTIIEGGTGSLSARYAQPDFLPDRFESGSLSNPLISALGAGIDFVTSYGIDRIYSDEMKLIRRLYGELEQTDKVNLYTPYPEYGKTAPILSFNLKDYPSEKTADLLARENIAVRGGLHCAPLAHKSFDTLDTGTVRISPSVFTTKKDCDILIKTVKKL